MVVVSRLPHAEFGRNDHREDSPYFSILKVDIPVIHTHRKIMFENRKYFEIVI